MGAVFQAVAQPDDGLAELTQVSPHALVGNLSALHLIGPNIHAPWDDVHIEPGQYRFQRLVDAEVVMVGIGVPHQTHDLAHKGFDRNMVKQVLEGPGVGTPVDGRADDIGVGGINAFKDVGGIVRIVFGWSTVTKRDGHVTQIDYVGRDIRGVCLRGCQCGIDNGPRTAAGRQTP